MAFTSYDQIINALSVNRKGQYPIYDKLSAAFGTTVGDLLWASLWNAQGTPSSGQFGTALTARQVDNTFVGAIPFTNPASGATMHLLNVGVMSTTNVGMLLLVDRLLEAPFDGTATAGVFNSGVPLVIPSRDINGSASGEGLFMFVENVDGTTSSTAPKIKVIYTNSLGATGHTTGDQGCFPSCNQHRILTSGGIWLPLQTGDTGVQAISGYALTASLTSTRLNIVICRPIAYIPCNIANAYFDRDTVLQIPNLPRLYNGTALQFLVQGAQTTSSGNVRGSLCFAEN